LWNLTVIINQGWGRDVESASNSMQCWHSFITVHWSLLPLPRRESCIFLFSSFPASFYSIPLEKRRGRGRDKMEEVKVRTDVPWRGAHHATLIA
jgi:hypothetical protein